MTQIEFIHIQVSVVNWIKLQDGSEILLVKKHTFEK